MAEEPFAPHFRDWTGVWQFPSAEETAARLVKAGFVDVATSLEAAATTFATEPDYREFVTTVIYHPHLARLPEPLRPPFIEEITRRAATQAEPFTLDYWRLNLQARKPS
jgi:hypothetical protein